MNSFGMKEQQQTGRRKTLAGTGAGMAAYVLSPFFHIPGFAQNASAGAVVETTYGKLRGTGHNGIHSFKGIQYGAPTGGKMRFMPPAKPAPWTGVHDAFKFGHQSPQNHALHRSARAAGGCFRGRLR